MTGLSARSLLVMLALFASGAPLRSAAQATIPHLQGTSLAGNTVTLPDGSASTPSLLVVGFSQKSTDAATLWGRRTHDAIPASSLTVYTLPVLVEVPRLVRGLVLHEMRKSVPPAVQPRFVPILDHEDEWKQAAHFDKPDEVYVLLVDAQGHIRWRAEGPVTDARLAELESQLKLHGL